MGLMDNLGNLLNQVTGGAASDNEVHSAYDQVAQAVPQGDLAAGLAHAFQSDQTPPFHEMITGLFNQSNPDQKAGLLNQLMRSLGPGGVASALSALGGAGALGGLLNGTHVTPEQAQQVPPEAAEILAQHAAKKDPSIMDTAASFYAQHPTLVKAIGAGALALLMSKISQSRR